MNSADYNWKIPVWLGNVAEAKCDELIRCLDVENEWNRNYLINTTIRGMWQNNNGTWEAFDNMTGNCWVESFDSPMTAYLWCTGQVEIGENI